MKRIVLITMMVLPVLYAKAQEADYYRMEIGGGLGLWNYLGDFNGNILKGFQPQITAMWKYLPNERMAIKTELSYGKVKGDTKNVTSYLPEEWRNYSFNSTLYDFNVMFEYNFWKHGMNGDYRHLHRLVPYIAIGLGGTFIHNDHVGNKAALSFPLGIGAKYKLAERLNLGAEWLVHFTTSDYIDGAKDPLSIKSSGIFKNTDGFGQLKIYITYSFMAKCRQCNN